MQSIRSILNKPLIRGMVVYSVLSPVSSLIQQTMSGNRPGNYDWAKCARFSVFGALFVAPTIHAWMRFVGELYPKRTFGAALSKSVVDQVCFGPFSIASFFFGMSMLENRDLVLACKDVSERFLPTYKVASCYWPLITVVNYKFVPKHHRVIVISLCSVVYTTFLAHIKELEQEEAKNLLAFPDIKAPDPTGENVPDPNEK